MYEPLLNKTLLPLAFAASTLIGGALAAFADTADALPQTEPTTFITVMASVLASGGIVGYSVKRFVDNQIARAEANREQDRADREQDRADRAEDRDQMQELMNRYIEREASVVAFYQAQISQWQKRCDDERDRYDRIIVQITNVPSAPRKDPS